MVFQYAPPGGALPERPKCWGMEQHLDTNSKECRGCHARNSCQDQIVRIKNTQQQGLGWGPYVPQQQQQVMQQPAYQQPVFGNVAPQGQMRAMAPQQVPVFQPQQMPQRQQQQQMSPHPQPPGYGFGWMQDPLYYQMAASPPPMRPQFQGEHFLERVGKNVALAMAESLMIQLLLGIRQAVFAPRALPPHHDQGQGQG